MASEFLTHPYSCGAIKISEKRRIPLRNVSKGPLSLPRDCRVPHISLVFGEMWDTTALSFQLSIYPTGLAVNIGGILHLAKNERNVGHGGFRFQMQQN
jgi:hypothetical protein